MLLCRPPGHHAYIDRASGFCYFNNAAIAAEILRERYSRVAILDFDTHHGDGTQATFYRRDDVFFGSTHTDPSAYYPYFAGYADERGAGDGEGFNLNLPLVPGSGDGEVLAAVERLAEAAAHVGARALVVSAGWDAHRDDPLSKLKVTSEAYGRVGEILASLRLPTMIVQEGGYSLAAVAEAAPNFIEGFRGRDAPLSSPLAGEDVTRSATDEGESSGASRLWAVGKFTVSHLRGNQADRPKAVSLCSTTPHPAGFTGHLLPQGEKGPA